MYCLNCHQEIENYENNCQGCGVYLPNLTREFLPLNQTLHEGKYCLTHYLGRGGFGLTYAAEQVLLKQQVAIKEFYLMESSYRMADNKTVSTSAQLKEAFDESLKRFLREGQILARINHPNVVRVIDLFEENGTAYLVMEYLKGQTLKQYKPEERPLSSGDVLKLAEELVSALSALHAEGVYHLDLKPENILQTEQGLKLIDFGSAKTISSRTQTRYSYTETYAAPELLTSMGVKPAAQTDLYELGVVLYELLTGELPPDPMQRAFNPVWSLQNLNEPWHQLLTEALKLMPAQRPNDIALWWASGIKSLSKSSRHDSIDTPNEHKECPYCAERIKSKAKKCRYCGEFLENQRRDSIEKPPTLSNESLSKESMNAARGGIFVDTGARPFTSSPVQVNSVPKKFTNHLGMEFVLIQPGTFMMGSPDGEAERYNNEILHQVTLTESFYLQSTPVTQEQWTAVMGSNPSYFRDQELPVEQVSWADCQEFIEKLNRQGEGRYALPTEAQWEYACRAGSNTPFAIGNGIDLDSSQANFNGNFPYGKRIRGVKRKATTPVKTFSPNAWGLYDMHGNIWEWVADCYGEYPRGFATDPTGPETGSHRVLRGGSWNSHARYCRSAHRGNRSPGLRLDSFGFRLLRYP